MKKLLFAFVLLFGIATLFSACTKDNSIQDVDSFELQQDSRVKDGAATG